MTALDPALLENAARALPLHRMITAENREELARAVLSVVADPLRAEGARQVLAAVENVGDVHDAYPWILRAARKVVAQLGSEQP